MVSRYEQIAKGEVLDRMALFSSRLNNRYVTEFLILRCHFKTYSHISHWPSLPLSLLGNWSALIPSILKSHDINEAVLGGILTCAIAGQSK